ncbi:hypothetical protein B0T21DRAFT_250815, partial [Apiosordaria backusii]
LLKMWAGLKAAPNMHPSLLPLHELSKTVKRACLEQAVNANNMSARAIIAASIVKGLIAKISSLEQRRGSASDEVSGLIACLAKADNTDISIMRHLGKDVRHN